ncbi:MAG: hypothetical protein ACQESR_28155, partial [Planctomycetota bacterium]
SPLGEDQLARTYVAWAQQKKRIRHTTKDKLNPSKGRASRLSSTAALTRPRRVNVTIPPDQIAALVQRQVNGRPW